MKQALTKNSPSPMFVRCGGDLVLLAAIGAAIALTNLLLSHPELSVFHKLVDIAAWLRGAGAKPDVVTWPAWGYAWLIAWLPNFGWIIALQACLGALVLIALVRRLRPIMPRQSVIVAVLCVLAVPWHDMQVTLYPSGLAGSLALLALFIGICTLALKHWRVVETISMKPVGVFILSALVLQLPWAFFYHAETGR